MHVRHFLALRPDEPALRELLAVPVPDGTRAVHPQDLHLTLAFLGTLDSAAETRVIERVKRVGGGRVVVRLDSAEVWEGPRVLCAVGAGETIAPVAGLAGALMADLRAELPDLAGSREAFRAHVTLARKVTASRPPVKLPRPIVWTATSIELMASRGDGALPRYVRRGSVPLPA